MKKLFPIRFKDCFSLVEELKKKCKNYPLIMKWYIPIIEKHKKKYKNHDINFDDWLLIPFFQALIFSSPDGLKQLESVEEKLQLINRFFKETRLEELLRDFHKDAMHPRINCVYNKIVDFYTELEAIVYYINSGYNVEKISVNLLKTADFCIAKNDYPEDISIVECKRMHPSNPYKVFIELYISLLSRSGVLRKNEIFSFDLKFSFYLKADKFPQDLSGEEIIYIKKMINEHVQQKKIISVFDCGKCKIECEYKPKMETHTVSIENQILFLIDRFEIFFENNIVRTIGEAGEQANSSAEKKYKKYVYISVGFDQENPFLTQEELEDMIKDLFVNQKSKINITDITIILKIDGYNPIEIKI